MSKGSLEEHKSYVMNCLKRLDDGNLRINLPKLAVTQSASHKGNRVNNISSESEFKEQIAKTFPELISGIGRSKNHVAKSKFHKVLQPKHKKSRRIPINLQE